MEDEVEGKESGEGGFIRRESSSGSLSQAGSNVSYC